MSSREESPLKKAAKFTLALFSIVFIFAKWMMKSGIQILRNEEQLDATARPKMSSGAERPWKTVAKSALAIFSTGFNSSKCRMAAMAAVDRIQLLRNKEQFELKCMRIDIALLLESGEYFTACIKVEAVISLHNFIIAAKCIEAYCGRFVRMLVLIAKERDCPKNMKETISSLIFASSQCASIPELRTLCDNFEKKYGRDFVQAAIEGCCVDRVLRYYLAFGYPVEMKLEVLNEIAEEHNIKWDPTKAETLLHKLELKCE